MQELRCTSKKHGELNPDDGIIEVKCDSRFCKGSPDVVVIHQFDSKTGELVSTKRYREIRRK